MGQVFLMKIVTIIFGTSENPVAETLNSHLHNYGNFYLFFRQGISWVCVYTLVGCFLIFFLFFFGEGPMVLENHEEALSKELKKIDASFK